MRLLSGRLAARHAHERAPGLAGEISALPTTPLPRRCCRTSSGWRAKTAPRSSGSRSPRRCNDCPSPSAATVAARTRRARGRCQRSQSAADDLVWPDPGRGRRSGGARPSRARCELPHDAPLHRPPADRGHREDVPRRSTTCSTFATDRRAGISGRHPRRHRPRRSPAGARRRSPPPGTRSRPSSRSGPHDEPCAPPRARVSACSSAMAARSMR